MSLVVSCAGLVFVRGRCVSMVSSRIQLSVLPLELLRADVHCPVVEILLVYMIVTKRGSLFKDSILDDREATVDDAASLVVDQRVASTVAHLDGASALLL